MASHSAVILVPGYYGTRLIQASDNRLMWLSVGQAFGDGPSLTLPLTDLGLIGPDLHPDGLLMDIPIVPWLYRIEAYGSISKTLQASGVQVVPLNFDWRGDLMDAVRQLHEQVENLRRSGVDRIALVAHSMGGLIASYYLRYGMQDPQHATETWEGASFITTVVLAGVPFGGSMAVFRNMIYGRPIGLNKTLLSFEAVSSFPASYYVLPHSNSDVLFTSDETERRDLIGDASSWVHYHWGLLREQDSYPTDIVRGRLAYVNLWLQRAHRFHDLLHAPFTHGPSEPSSLLSIVGVGQSTLASGYLNEEAKGRSSIGFDDDALPLQLRSRGQSLFQDGDGTVTGKASALPDAYLKCFVLAERVYQAEHSELMNRQDIQRVILNFVREGLRLPRDTPGLKNPACASTPRP
jgi:pimeloyl-ACP methyl ester carboxylesterase